MPDTKSKPHQTKDEPSFVQSDEKPVQEPKSVHTSSKDIRKRVEEVVESLEDFTEEARLAGHSDIADAAKRARQELDVPPRVEHEWTVVGVDGRATKTVTATDAPPLSR